jgi:hypothetical protein
MRRRNPLDRQQEPTHGEQLSLFTHYDSSFYHYHNSGGDNYHDRTLYYHDHPASYILNDDGEVIHDHRHEYPTYVNEPATE